MANDIYIESVLRSQYNLHKQYVIERKKLSNEMKIPFRLPSIPEDISENIIKFILHKNGETTTTWYCKKGDLYSQNGLKECKCFTSNAPISFTPKSNWEAIYFLDAREWLNDKFVLYEAKIKRTSPEWKIIKVNKRETFEDHCNQKRRPRLNWKTLYPQIKDNCQKIFEGTFEDIFIPLQAKELNETQ